jgi:hypothetical protein
MPLPLEASTWDEGRIQEEIILRLPRGWIFSVKPSEGSTCWEVTFLDVEEAVVWKGEHFVIQLALLDALGWLEAREAKPREESAWNRRKGELNPQRPHDRLFSVGLTGEDPSDLDPGEIASVYSSRPRRS